MDTCLFTGEPLTPTTREEHTIPESLGGRIKSRFVTSDTFNNLCGSRLDHTLKLPYEPLLNQLAPLLPRTSQPGRMAIDVPGEASGLVLEGGRVTRQGVLVVTRDEKGRPKTAVGEDEDALKKLARSMKKKPEEMKLSEIKATEAGTFYKKVPIVCREFEIVALKSILLTFDHLLRGSSDHFTRHPDLGPARDFIRDAVIGQRADAKALGQFSLGLQYEKRGLYDHLRSQVGVPTTDFEHVLFVSTEARTRTLEMVWLVFGFDPFGFQICPWPHGSFTYAVVNPVLRDEGYSGPIRLANPGKPLCEPTDLCSIPWHMTEKDDPQPVMDRISQERRDAYGRAVKLVEMTCDENLIDCFCEAAVLSAEDERSVQGQVRARLIRMYGRKKDDSGFVAEADAALARRSEGVPSALLTRRLDLADPSDPIDWPSVIRLYRLCLGDLEQKFGLPGDNFSKSSGYVVDPSDQRLIGKLPPMGP
jgi:hypothetical protein